MVERGYGDHLIFYGERVRVRGEDRAVVLSRLFGHWAGRDVDAIVEEIASLSQADADGLIEDLCMVTRLVVECKEVL